MLATNCNALVLVHKHAGQNNRFGCVGVPLPLRLQWHSENKTRATCTALNMDNILALLFRYNPLSCRCNQCNFRASLNSVLLLQDSNTGCRTETEYDEKADAKGKLNIEEKLNIEKK